MGPRTIGTRIFFMDPERVIQVRRPHLPSLPIVMSETSFQEEQRTKENSRRLIASKILTNFDRHKALQF